MKLQNLHSFSQLLQTHLCIQCLPIIICSNLTLPQFVFHGKWSRHTSPKCFRKRFVTSCIQAVPTLRPTDICLSPSTATTSKPLTLKENKSCSGYHDKQSLIRYRFTLRYLWEKWNKALTRYATNHLALPTSYRYYTWENRLAFALQCWAWTNWYLIQSSFSAYPWVSTSSSEIVLRSGSKGFLTTYVCVRTIKQKKLCFYT